MCDAFIDHITVEVADLDRSRRFYERALEPLGVRQLEITNPDSAEPEVVYGAFVPDPDGNNVEAVCHEPQLAGP